MAQEGGKRRMENKDKTIHLLTLLVILQVLVNAGLLAWHYHEIEEIKETADFAKGLAMDSYNSNIYAQNYNVDLTRDVWHLQDYLNYTMGYNRHVYVFELNQQNSTKV